MVKASGQMQKPVFPFFCSDTIQMCLIHGNVIQILRVHLYQRMQKPKKLRLWSGVCRVLLQYAAKSILWSMEEWLQTLTGLLNMAFCFPIFKKIL